MKIAQITCTFPPYSGGIGNCVYNLAENLADLGHAVTVFTPDYNYQHNGEDSPGEGKFKVKRLRPVFKIGNAALIPQLFWQLGDFDVVHLHYPFYGAIGAVLFRKLFFGKKFKLVVHYHMDSRAGDFTGLVFYLYRIFILPLVARAAKIITCASIDYIKHSDLKKYYLTHENKFRQILFGVSLEQFVTYHNDLYKKRPHKEILFVGGLDRAHYFKGLENLIKAFAEIVKIKRYDNAILNVVGRGEMAEYYKKRAALLGLSKSVIFNENVDNSKLVDFYNYCDFLVLPSINQGEAFGLVLLEAMSCSKPVITSNLPGVRSVFKNGREGFLVKPGDVEDLVKRMLILLGDRNLAERMGKAGRELVEKRYTWDKVGKKLDVIFHFVRYSPK